MSKTWDRSRRIVEGALLSTINDHGPIGETLVSSASKRVVAQLAAAAGAVVTDECRGAIENLHRRLDKLRHGHDRLLSQHERCRIERDASNALIRDILVAVCERDGHSFDSAADPGAPARNYELALRLGIGHIFGLKETADTDPSAT